MACELQLLQPDLVNPLASPSDAVMQELANQVPVTRGPSSVNESPIVDSMLTLPSSLDASSTLPIFAEASESAVRLLIHQEAGGSGDAEGSSLVKGLLEVLGQRQWNVRMSRVIQLHVMSASSVITDADAAESLLCHRRPHVVAFRNDQITRQRHQRTAIELTFEGRRHETKLAAERAWSPRQQKPRLIARGNRTSIQTVWVCLSWSPDRTCYQSAVSQITMTCLTHSATYLTVLSLILIKTCPQ